MVTIVPIDTPTLGDRSYLAHDGRVALVIDPQRDVDRVLALADEAGVQITHVFETHIHNDYVTGGYALAQATGASYHVNGDDEVSFERTPAGDGDRIEVSPSMVVRVIATPGHTYTHLSYALSFDGEPVGVFTGGSLLFGATGRPDLLGHEHTDDLVHHQFASAQRLAQELPDAAQVLPTHGFGSFCSAGSTGDTTESTIGGEKQLQPRPDPGRGAVGRRHPRGPRRLPRLLRAHGPGQQRRPGPARTSTSRSRPTRRCSPRGSRTASGSSTCAPAPPSPPGTSPAPSTSASTASSPPTSAGSSPGAHRSPSSASPPSRSPRPSVSWSGSASTASRAPTTGTPHGLDRRAARLLRASRVRRPGEGAPPPRGRRSSTSAALPSSAAGHIEGAVNIPIHEILDRLDDVPLGRGMGPLRRRLPGLRRRIRPRRPWRPRRGRRRQLRRARGRRRACPSRLAA